MRNSVFVITLVLAMCPVLALGQTIHLTSSEVATTPVVLDQPNTTYILETDVIAQGSAFVIAYSATGSQLNLNGHTVTFGNTSGDYRYGILLASHNYRDDFWPDAPASAFGGQGAMYIQIFGGRVQQGAGGGSNCAAVSGPGFVEIRDNELEVTGIDCRPIYLAWSKGATVSNNTILDRSLWVSNRHQGRASIDIEGGDVNAAFLIEGNTITESPQWGIRVQRRTNEYSPTQPVVIRNNDISQNTVVTNGYGIGIHSGMTECYGNYVHPVNGRGIHLNTYSGMEVYNNIVEVREIGNSEYSYMYSHGINLELPSNAEVYDNTVTSIARHDSDTYYTHPLTGVTNSTYSAGQSLVINVAENSNCRVFNNHFIAIHEGGDQATNDHFADYASAFYIRRIPPNSDLELFGNTFESNSQLLGVSWDNAGDAILDLTHNLWVRNNTPAGAHQFVESFHTNREANSKYRIINPVFQGDVDFRHIQFTAGTGAFTIDQVWDCSIRVLASNEVGIPGAAVSAWNNQGQVVWESSTNSQGEVSVQLAEFTLDFNGSSYNTIEGGQYSIHVSYEGEMGSANLDLPDVRDLEILLGNVTIEGPGIPEMYEFNGDNK